LNLGIGNLYSLANSLEKLGAYVTINKPGDSLDYSDAIILPGVGAYRDAIGNLRKANNSISDQIKSGKHLLGICLGMQLFFTESHEDGLHKGLNLLEGPVTKLPSKVRTPHIGWNTLHNLHSHPLFKGINEGSYVYYAHSYAPEPLHPEIVIATSTYGRTYPAAVAKDRIYGTQFHPEKSGKVGIHILQNFLKIITNP
jgi:glutamine amidotransferase